MKDKNILKSNPMKILWGFIIRGFFIYMLYIFYTCMETISSRMICGLVVLVITGVLVVTALPIKIILEEDGILYKRLGFAEKRYMYKWMYDSQKTNVTFNFIIPLYSKYNIYIMDDQGKRKKVRCGSLKIDDFDLLLEVFMTVGIKKLQKENANNGLENRITNLYQEIINVPQQEIKKRNTFFWRCVIGGIFIFGGICCCIEKWTIPSRTVQDLIVEWIVCSTMFSVYPLICWWRKRKENKKIPEKILLYNDFFEIDQKKYYLDKVMSGYIVPEQYKGKRIFGFEYEGEDIEYYFGKQKSRKGSNEKEYFEQYENLVRYFINVGFSATICT